MRKRKPPNASSDKRLGYDERVKAPDEAEDVETVVRALLDVPRPKDGQATKAAPPDSPDERR